MYIVACSDNKRLDNWRHLTLSIDKIKHSWILCDSGAVVHKEGDISNRIMCSITKEFDHTEGFWRVPYKYTLFGIFVFCSYDTQFICFINFC